MRSQAREDSLLWAAVSIFAQHSLNLVLLSQKEFQLPAWAALTQVVSSIWKWSYDPATWKCWYESISTESLTLNIGQLGTLCLPRLRELWPGSPFLQVEANVGVICLYSGTSHHKLWSLLEWRCRPCLVSQHCILCRSPWCWHPARKLPLNTNSLPIHSSKLLSNPQWCQG